MARYVVDTCDNCGQLLEQIGVRTALLVTSYDLATGVPSQLQFCWAGGCGATVMQTIRDTVNRQELGALNDPQAPTPEAPEPLEPEYVTPPGVPVEQLPEPTPSHVSPEDTHEPVGRGPRSDR